jgi:hypothetical protein
MILSHVLSIALSLPCIVACVVRRGVESSVLIKTP